MREDLRKIIEDNWADIQELIIEKVEAEQKPKSIWDLKTEDGEQYYVLRTTGDINIDYFSSRLDEYIREVGNVFLTREDAEFEQERRKIETIMKKYSRPFTKNKRNYYIYYDCAFGAATIDIYHTVTDGVPYFESREIAQQVIDEIGEDRLKKYWFGVENDERREQ